MTAQQPTPLEFFPILSARELYFIRTLVAKAACDPVYKEIAEACLKKLDESQKDVLGE